MSDEQGRVQTAVEVWHDEDGWRVRCPVCLDTGTYADDERNAREDALTHVCPSGTGWPDV